MDISVIIPTHNRVESLRQTMDCLVNADRTGLTAEVVVVNNGSSEPAQTAAKSFAARLPLRYFYEPEHGVYGKSHALNRALDEGELGDIIAILDDDMSPHNGWFQGVKAICSRRPEVDLFTGKSFIIWPDTPVPPWAHDSKLQGWLFSIQDWGNQDKTLPANMWFLGGHFWFRSRVVQNGMRFRDMWLTEPDYMLRMVEFGYQAIYGPDAVTGHRIQPHLLDKHQVLTRAIKVGETFARLRLNPEFTKLKHVRAFKEHYLLALVYCGIFFSMWTAAYYLSYLYPDRDESFSRRVYALERKTAFRTFFADRIGVPA
jgi:glycosyltransferase involved in cell wall biosynthesis